MKNLRAYLVGALCLTSLHLWAGEPVGPHAGNGNMRASLSTQRFGEEILATLSAGDRKRIQQVEEVRMAAWAKVAKKMKEEPMKSTEEEYGPYEKAKGESMQVFRQVYRAALLRAGFNIRSERLHKSDGEYHALVERNGRYFFLEADDSILAWEVDPADSIMVEHTPARQEGSGIYHTDGLPEIQFRSIQAF